MSSLASREWCDIVFEGRNKEYGAYRARANKGKFQLRALIFLLIFLGLIFAFIIAKTAVESAIEKNRALEGDMVTELSQLKKEEPKKEEKKKEPELKYEEPKEKVKVKASMQFTVPKIVDDDKIDHSKELKTQDEVTKSSFAIASQDYAGDGDGGINIDDLKDNQSAGGTNVPKEEEVMDNELVEIPAQYPGGNEALLAHISKNLVYPRKAQEEEIQGTVVLRFQVQTNGQIGEIQVRKKLDPACDQAAIDVLRKARRFTPAKQQGRPVAVWFTVPIRFQIQ